MSHHIMFQPDWGLTYPDIPLIYNVIDPKYQQPMSLDTWFNRNIEPTTRLTLTTNLDNSYTMTYGTLNSIIDRTMKELDDGSSVTGHFGASHVEAIMTITCQSDDHMFTLQFEPDSEYYFLYQTHSL